MADRASTSLHAARVSRQGGLCRGTLGRRGLVAFAVALLFFRGHEAFASLFGSPAARRPLVARQQAVTPVETTVDLQADAAATTAAFSARREEEFDPYMDQVRQGFNRERLMGFFSNPMRAADVALRWAEIVSVGYPALKAWEDETIPAEERGVPMRAALASLGPVFVKIGQTLAERPDLVGMDGATELRKLQTQNEPFDDEVAYQMIIEDMSHAGPLSPGGFVLPGGDAAAKPLFSSFGPRVATASLGQVYQAMTWGGQKVAVKVQRKAVAKQVVLDWQCLKSLLDLGNAIWKRTDDISLIADTAITGIMEELDYHKEAANALLFLERHRSQPWITAPRFLPKYTGPVGTARVLTMEWIEGRRVGQIEDKKEQLRLVNMAVEACVSQLVGTGFVHVDPHEGNILLTDDGRIAFLDFGLMGHVPAFVMEGFAAGIQHTLSGNYIDLAQVMKEVEFIPKEGFQRVHGDPLEPGEYYFTDCSKEEFAGALEAIMDKQEGGKTQFGAFFIGLLEMSKNYRLTTPPYIILFVRTFLTLEGIAATYDPTFNIYEVGMPFAMRRALAPSTDSAVQAFRGNLLTDENKLKWETIQDLMEAEADMSAANAANATAAAPAGEAGEEAEGSAGYSDALNSLLGAPEGRTVRRVLSDVDLSSLARFVVSIEGKPLRRKASEVLAGALTAAPRAAGRWLRRRKGASQEEKFRFAWEEEEERVRQKQLRRWARARSVIIGRHIQKLRSEPVAIGLMALAATKVVLRAGFRVSTAPVRTLLQRFRKEE